MAAVTSTCNATCRIIIIKPIYMAIAIIVIAIIILIGARANDLL